MIEIKGKLKDLTFTLDGKQIITIETETDCRTMFDEFKDKLLTICFKLFKKKRSLDANAYFWVLCDKLAGKTNIPKTEIYRQYIKEIGDNCETVCVKDKAVEKLVNGWQHNGLGWLTDTFKSKLGGCTNVILYYGSSEYDTAQMSRLIDLIVQECKEQGIETMTQFELDRLKEEWNEQKK